MVRVGVLLVAAVCSASAQPQAHVYDGETDEEMMERARAAAAEQGYDPNDVVTAVRLFVHAIHVYDDFLTRRCGTG